MLRLILVLIPVGLSSACFRAPAAQPPDAGVPDASAPDAGTPDSGPIDSDAGVGTSDDAGLPTLGENVCAMLSAGYCSWQVRCGMYASFEGCMAALWIPDHCGAYLDPSIADGRFPVDPAQLAACKDFTAPASASRSVPPEVPASIRRTANRG